MTDTVEKGLQPNPKPPPEDERLILGWLESQIVQTQKDQTADRLRELLEKASQPRHASGNACVKLCFFVEQCRSSQSPYIREIVYSEKTCLNLFNFFIDWNEKNQNRSMRQVLELTSSLISQNEKKELIESLQNSILNKTLSIITHQGAQPLVKPSFKALECFLAKGTISPDNLLFTYKGQIPQSKISGVDWDTFFLAIFEWMDLPDVSPAAGKFLVTLFRELKKKSLKTEDQERATASWQRWIKAGLGKYPQALENVKNYLLQPLFRLDRSGSLEFLVDLNTQSTTLNFQNHEADFHALLQLAAIETGKKAGLIEEPNPLNYLKPSKKPTACLNLEEEKIGSLLSHSSGTVRALAFSVLVSSSSVRPFSEVAMNILRSNMAILYSDTDAKFRNETLSSSKHMIERLRGATALLVRDINTLSFQPSSEKKPVPDRPEKTEALLKYAKELLENHRSFLEWYIDFLLGELIPTASYQRHIAALKATEMLLRSGLLVYDLNGEKTASPRNTTTWPYALEFFVPMSMRLLIDLLMNPFEDVRSGAASILRLAVPKDFSIPQPGLSQLYQRPKLSLEKVYESPSKVTINKVIFETHPPITWNAHGAPPLPLLTDFLAQANKALARTGRADYADGVAHCYKLLYVLQGSADVKARLLNQLVDDLEAKITIARADLGEAVLNAPIHGTFAALSAVWSIVDLAEDFKGYGDAGSQTHWEGFQFRIANACSDIWDIVKDVLCNDSPEGHLPEDIEEGDIIDTKDILSYSFRAIHESSKLLRILVDKTNHRCSRVRILPTNIFAQIGDLTFAQLSNLRHRGAFSTVSLTFARCCQLTQDQDFALYTEQSLLRKWYQDSLDCIFTQVSTTRRSAGIPALVTGIMAANSMDPNFEEVILELLRIASLPVLSTQEDLTNLPQVHALNSLRDTIKGAATGRRAEKYLDDCMKVAANSLNHPVWAIRNCGLLLFRSIIDYLLGTNTRKAVIESGWDGKSVKIAYESHPNLPGILIDILRTDTISPNEGSQCNSGAIESVFPVLDLIRRAGPPQAQSETIKNLVLGHLRSRVWDIRDIAAHTISTLIPKDTWVSEVQGMLEATSQNTSHNHRYGTLCAVRYILERGLKDYPTMMLDGIEKLGPILLAQREQDFENSSFTCAAHAGIMVTIALILRSWEIMEDNSEAGANIRKLFDSLFANHPLETLQMWFSESTTSVEGPLACKEMVRLAVFTAALQNNVQGLQKVLDLAFKHSDELGTSALESVQQIWTGMSIIPRTLLLNMEKMVPFLAEKSHEMDKISRPDLLYHLNVTTSVTLEILSRCSPETFLDVLHTTQPLPKRLPGQPSPAEASYVETSPVQYNDPIVLQAERLKIDAWEVLHYFLSEKPHGVEIEAKTMEWSISLSLSSDPNKEYYERVAVAQSLHFFYRYLFFGDRRLNDESLLPSLLVLYDIMNDDDEEIRNLGAATVSNFFQEALAPPKAQNNLLQWLVVTFGKSELLKWNILCRATGTCNVQKTIISTGKIFSTGKLAAGRGLVKLTPASDHFLKAEAQNDELFAIESQNLYEDPVREVRLWTTAWMMLPAEDLTKDTDSPVVFIAYAHWVDDGLRAFSDHIKETQNSTSWSKPAEYAACFRVLRMANILLSYHHRYYKDCDLLREDRYPRSYKSSIRTIVKAIGQFLNRAICFDLPDFLLTELIGPRKLDENGLSKLLADLEVSFDVSLAHVNTISDQTSTTVNESTNAQPQP